MKFVADSRRGDAGSFLPATLSQALDDVRLEASDISLAESAIRTQNPTQRLERRLIGFTRAFTAVTELDLTPLPIEMFLRCFLESPVGAEPVLLRSLPRRSRASAPLPVRGGRSRRHYALTGAGARAIRDAERHTASIWAGVRPPVRPKPA